MREDGMRIQDTNRILQESRDLRNSNSENEMSWMEGVRERISALASRVSGSVRHNRMLQAGLISIATAATAGVVSNRIGSHRSRRGRWF
jgi:hypothetical protein